MLHIGKIDNYDDYGTATDKNGLPEHKRANPKKTIVTRTILPATGESEIDYHHARFGGHGNCFVLPAAGAAGARRKPPGISLATTTGTDIKQCGGRDEEKWPRAIVQLSRHWSGKASR